MIQKTKNHSSR